MQVKVKLESLFNNNLIEHLLKHYDKKKSVCGQDGVYPNELRHFWEENGEAIKKLILSERYTPVPAEKVFIPKPGSKKKRELLVPCAVDAMIMKGIDIILRPYYERVFSYSSFGFRRGRGCLHALQYVIEILNAGYDYIVSIDLASYFDTINHNKLYEILDRDIKDKRLIRLIMTYIKTKVVCGHHIYKNYIGVPQGSSLSPLLANIYLNEFDQMMDRNGYQYVRYADDIVIFARSESEKDKVYEVAYNFLIKELKLEINNDKTVITKDRLEYLGYEIKKNNEGKYVFYISEKKKTKVYDKMKKNMRKRSQSEVEWLDRIGAFNRGWLNYYKYSDRFDTQILTDEVDKYQNECIKQKVSITESRGYITMSDWWDLLKRQEGGS